MYTDADATVPPLVLDIDGTLTDAPGRLDPRVPVYLQSWDAPIVLATGKSFPFPVALCHFLGIEQTVIAENGGVVLADETVSYQGDSERAQAAASVFEERGGELGWGGFDDVNKWRETEIAVDLSADEELLREVAAEFDLTVIDTGYAYHLKASRRAMDSKPSVRHWSLILTHLLLLVTAKMMSRHLRLLVGHTP